ncbi:MAG: ribosome small subunit-dependent GTPase A [Ignavibacteriaceae bacterium]|nr:ribosome small subunit-dependent GTPase A [Ignavibacteriaceae bacterium]
MELTDLGYDGYFENYRTENNLDFQQIARVIAEHKERYIIRALSGELEAEITGNMRYAAEGREDFPAVGDWVSFVSYDPGFAIINKIFPRFSAIKRQAAGGKGEVQLIAVNVDYAFLVQSAGHDFNINRFERYLTVCYSSKVSPVILLTKTDLITDEQLSLLIESINQRIEGVPVLAISNATMAGYDKLNQAIERGKTYCLLGSSGVGKSSMINNLSGRNVMKTDEISWSTNKGKHVTTHRELVLLESGGILIDNPGMREVGIADTTNGLEKTFDKIIALSEGCKYKDCTHIHESGCAVLEAIESGEIDKHSYENYLKMHKEKAYFESTQAERKKKEKQMGKLLKNYNKEFRKDKR